jgi:hypothetical protein
LKNKEQEMPPKKNEESFDIEKLMQQVRRKVEKKREARYTDEEILELLDIDPGDPLDVRAVRDDFFLTMEKARAGGALRPLEIDFESYLGTGAGLRGKIIRKTRRLFWPVARMLWNQGYVIDMLNHMNKTVSHHLHLNHNIILELTRLKIENDHIRDGYLVLIHKLEQMEQRQRALEKMLAEANAGKNKTGKR